jgi:hypothetical protein
VNPQNAASYIAAGAEALGIGEALIPLDAVTFRQANRIRELARRFLNSVETARLKNGTKIEGIKETRTAFLGLERSVSGYRPGGNELLE